MVLGGYAARRDTERARHIEELRELGIEPPEQMPAFWSVSPFLATTGPEITVQGGDTSGEIEYFLAVTEGGILVGSASDQTDRQIERVSIPRSKQLAPKILSAKVMRLEDVDTHWDDHELSSEVSQGQEWLPYQQASLAALLPPRELVARCFAGETPSAGTILLSGTVPLLDGVTRFWPRFRGRLRVGDIELGLAYRVDSVD